MQTNIDYWLWNSIISKTDCQKIINRGLEQIELDKIQGVDTKAITFGNQQKSKDRIISRKDLTLEELKEKKIDSNNVYVRDSNIAWLSDQWIYDLIWNCIE